MLQVEGAQEAAIRRAMKAITDAPAPQFYEGVPWFDWPLSYIAERIVSELSLVYGPFSEEPS